MVAPRGGRAPRRCSRPGQVDRRPRRSRCGLPPVRPGRSRAWTSATSGPTWTTTTPARPPASGHCTGGSRDGSCCAGDGGLRRRPLRLPRPWSAAGSAANRGSTWSPDGSTPPCPVCEEPMPGRPSPEDAALDPRNVYAATKVHQEHLCRAFASDHDVPSSSSGTTTSTGRGVRATRPTPGSPPSSDRPLAAGRPPQVFEDGGQTPRLRPRARRRPRERARRSRFRRPSMGP